MKKQIIAFVAAAALALPLAACGSSSTTSTTSTTGSTTSSSSSSSDFDAVEFYVAGYWRGSVETTGTSVYGNTSGSEPMVDVTPAEDGTVEVTPLEGHEDLLSGTGTWTGTEDALTIEIDGKTIELTVVDDSTLTADPADFGIDGFDELTFVLY